MLDDDHPLWEEHTGKDGQQQPRSAGFTAERNPDPRGADAPAARKIASDPGRCCLSWASAYAWLQPREQAANEGDNANAWRPPLPECVGGSGGRHGAYPPSVSEVSSGTH